MARIWSGYRYTLFTFLLLCHAFVLIISAQNIETGGLIGGSKKSNIFTLIVSLFSTFFFALVLWFNLIRKHSIITEVRWELIWVATTVLFDIIGIASIALNRPRPENCIDSNGDWNICAATGGLLALLILASISLSIHAFTLIIVMVQESGKTELNVWEFMAWDLPYTLKPRSLSSLSNQPPDDFAPGITNSQDGMVEVELGQSKLLPSVPHSSAGERELPLPPPVSYSGRRDPFTFSSVSSLLNPLPRQDQEEVRRYQLGDGPITPVPVAHPPVQRAFERISASMTGVPTSVSAYYAPTPVYERFARGGRDAPAETPSTSHSRTSPSPPNTPRRPRRREGDFVPWHAQDEHGIRRAMTERKTQPAPISRGPSTSQDLPSRPPRVQPGSLPNPNTHRSNRV